MTPSGTLVSIGIPLRNSEKLVDDVLQSVSAQEYDNLEFVLSDNASDDSTEEICRDHARRDPRIRYHRQPVNIGVDGNFTFVLRQARGEFFRWVGDDDRLEPRCISRCVDVLSDDPRLVLVTTQQTFRERDGDVRTAAYLGPGLGSSNAVDRLEEWLRLLNSTHLLMDPMYGVMRRAAVEDVPRATMLRSDQVFATRLAVTGPWAHINEVLAHRGWPDDTREVLARRMGLPRWRTHIATAYQARHLLGVVAETPMTAGERRRANQAVATWDVGGHRRRILGGARRVVGRARMPSARP